MYGKALHKHTRAFPSICILVALAALLWLPARSAQARDIRHVVRKGQNLGMIAKRYHTSARAIQRYNKMKPGKRIYPGQRLRIREVAEHRRWRRFLAEKHRPTKAPRKATPQKKPPAKKRSHTVRPAKSHAAARRTKRRPVNHKSNAARRARKPSLKSGPRHAQNAKRRARSSLKRHKKPLYAKYKRKPRRRGRVTMVRHSERFRGTLMNSKGQLIARSAKRVDHLLRSMRTGKQTTMNRRLLTLLARASAYFGHRAVILVSGYRPYSKKQYTRNSRHNHGKAVDFRIVGVPNRALFEYCRSLPHVGCGYYPNSVFVHMDVRKHKTQWTDFSRPGQRPIYAHRLKKKQRATRRRKRRR